MTASKDSSEFAIIKDLSALKAWVDQVTLRGFSMSPPLLVGGEFMLVVCQGSQLSDCTCIHVALERVRGVADVLFADRAKRVYVHALKEVLLWFKCYGIDLYAEMFLDVSLAAYLLDPPEPDRGEDWRKFLLSSLVREYLKEPYPFVYQGVAAKDYPEALYHLLVQDALYVWRLGPILVGEILKDETLLQPYWELEILLTAVLAEMELSGVGLDQARTARAEPKVPRALDVLYQELVALYGQQFNPRSADDVRSFLNRTCGLRLGRTDPLGDDLLKGLARSYPAAFKLRTYRRLLQTQQFLEKFQGKDRCYPRWWLTRTVVGRIGCTDPPFQSLPKYTRKYLSPGQGNVFIKADFSAFQLRLLAHLSQDQVLMDLFRSGGSPHDETKSRLERRGVSITRAQAKTVNFAICYGGTAWSLKDNLGLGFNGLKMAQQILGEMKEIYPRLFAYLEGIKEALESSPEGERYVRSIRGRRRGFSHPGDLTGREKRQAANAVVQMLEADVFKKTVLELDKAIKQESLPVEIVLLLHDGIWFTCPERYVQQAKMWIKQVMENSVALSVPLKVDLD
ncbi:MAG: DNA polymerase [Desulfomonilaceae bacterium]